jgi:orotidine-5'-phosphate decarboxylase
MTRHQLNESITQKKSMLCVGLDSDLTLIPAHLRERPNGLVEFNKQIIDATLEHCVAYKVNTAFYEALGARGWDALEETSEYIPESHFKIADAKRADIGNTSAQYARAFFERMQFDAVTVSPYMGEDSLRPFLDYPNKWTIVLGLTSNTGANDFELQEMMDGKRLFERVLDTVSKWGSPDNLMFVTGATRPEQLSEIRKIVPEHFLLVPGVGAQGGDLEAVLKHGANETGGLLINASRSIIYAGSEADFAEKAAAEAQQLSNAMRPFFSSSR